jgi:hypothetical protein
MSVGERVEGTQDSRKQRRPEILEVLRQHVYVEAAQLAKTTAFSALVLHGWALGCLAIHARRSGSGLPEQPAGLE